MKILLHACCGPCLVMPLEILAGEGAKTSVFFFNPNIHPYAEWKKRLETLEGHCFREKASLLPVAPYEPMAWFREITHREARRCALCYRLRLFEAAKIAKKGKFDCFTSTLLYSKYQKHEQIVAMGEEVAAEVGVPFLYRDFRPYWDEGVAKSREVGMYRQGYCGCLYSEVERYAKSSAKKGEKDG